MIKNQKDFLTGLLFLCLGVGFAWAAAGHPLGQMRQMGPGLLPLALGVALALLGVVLAFKALAFESVGGGRIAHWGLPGLLRVLGGLFWLALCNGPAQWPWVGASMSAWPTLGLVIGLGGFLLAVLPLRDPLPRYSASWALLLTLLVAGIWLVLGLDTPLWPTLAPR